MTQRRPRTYTTQYFEDVREDACNGEIDDRLGRAIVGSYATYPAAERAVRTLANAGIPFGATTIVARDVRLVQAVSSGLTPTEGGVRGAISGILAIGFLAALFAAFSDTDAIGLVVWGVVLGGFIGAITGALAVATRRRRFVAEPRLEAEEYELEVAPTFAAPAKAALSR